jgi:2-dehydropantoate 2-reductase
MRVAIIGAGAIGGYIGARLQHHGIATTFVARGATLAALRERGLALESPLGDVVLDRVDVTDDPRSLGAVELVVLAVKAWDVEAALAAVAPPSVVLTTQNGVESPLAIAERVGRDRTIVGLFRTPTLVVEPGRLHHIGGNAIQIGTLGPRIALLEELRPALQATISDDIFTAMWDKMIGMAVTTGIGALTRAPLGVLLDIPAVRDLVEGAMREAVAVARAHGANIAADHAQKAFANRAAFSRSTVFSTQRDILHGRPSELDTQIAAIPRLGRARGVPTPIFDVVAAALLPQELKARGELAYECT